MQVYQEGSDLVGQVGLFTRSSQHRLELFLVFFVKLIAFEQLALYSVVRSDFPGVHCSDKRLDDVQMALVPGVKGQLPLLLFRHLRHEVKVGGQVLGKLFELGELSLHPRCFGVGSWLRSLSSRLRSHGRCSL